MDPSIVQAGLGDLVSMWERDRNRQRAVGNLLRDHHVSEHLGILSEEAFGVVWRVLETATNAFDRDAFLLWLVLVQFLPHLLDELREPASSSCHQYLPARVVGGKIKVPDSAHRPQTFDANPGQTWNGHRCADMSNSGVCAEMLLVAVLLQLGRLEGLPASDEPLEQLTKKMASVTCEVQARAPRRPRA